MPKLFLLRALAGAVALAALPAAATPINSDMADSRVGGGCYATAFHPSVLDMLTLINPEWAPIVNPQTVDSDPVLISGTVDAMHGQTGGDFPSTHLLSDVVMDVHVDPEHEDKVATGNDAEGEIAFEWEVGKYPDWAWPGFGDHIYGLGRHIFDCGHTGGHPGNCSVTMTTQCVLDGDCRPPTCSTCGTTETCEGEHFGYSSELHPPHATAVIRQGRGAVVSKLRGAKPVPATIADVWVSPDGGGAGDRCVLTHRAMDAEQLTVECWPLAQPVAKINAQAFTFTIPLPPKPAGAGKPRWRIARAPKSADETQAFGGRPARVHVRKHLNDPTPSLEVSILMTKKVHGKLPTGFAGRIVAGWKDRTTKLTHVRITVSAIQVVNNLQRSRPLVPRACSVSNGACNVDGDCPGGEQCLGEGPVTGWGGQVAANGEWRRFSGSALDDVADGAVISQSIVLDQYLRADGTLRLQADAFARDCINSAYGHSLADGIRRLGLTNGITCFGYGESHAAGTIDVSYTAPDFGAGSGGSQTYETVSTGGTGGHCSLTIGRLCVNAPVDTAEHADCPVGETCNVTDGTFRLRYTIEKLS